VFTGRRSDHENPDAQDFPRLLRLANERRGQETSSRHEEGSAIHHWLIAERGMLGPNAFAV
jgi:hypothetical protein